MPIGRSAHAATIAISIAVASTLLWLGAEYRSDGALGALQDTLQPLYIFPYLFGGMLGGNVHAPSGGLVFAGLLLEIYVIIRAAGWLIGKTSTAVQCAYGRGSK